MSSDSNKSKDPIDEEVDEMLEMAKSGKFKPGIYNFCDRWCEKCKDTEKCFLFAQEKQRRTRKLSSAQVNDDEEIFWDEIKHNLELTRRLIERELREEGLDPQEVLKEAKKQKEWDDDADRRYDRVECLILAKKYLKEVHNFLENFHQNRFQFYQELGMEIDFSDIKEEIETISWYHTLLPTKIWRSLYERESLQREEDGELRRLMTKDLPKYFHLVKKCIQKSKMAWQNLLRKRKELTSVSRKFIAMLNGIEKKFNKEIITKKLANQF
jgi:hypothetical protein